jgi:hypothetical protein
MIFGQSDVQRLTHQRHDLEAALVPRSGGRWRVGDHDVVVGGQIGELVLRHVLVRAHQIDVRLVSKAGQQPGQQHLSTAGERRECDVARRLFHELAPL